MPLNIDWQQILLHLLNFTLLFGILYFLLYKPVKDFMDKRVQHYQELDDQAKEALAAAEAARSEQEQKLAAADEEIAAMKDAARTELNHALAERKEQALKSRLLGSFNGGDEVGGGFFTHAVERGKRLGL